MNPSDLDRHITGNYGEDSVDDTDPLVEAIVDIACCNLGDLRRAIDKAMYHAYSEGRADERQDWIEKALRAMNETGQGEHGVTHERL